MITYSGAFPLGHGGYTILFIDQIIPHLVRVSFHIKHLLTFLLSGQCNTVWCLEWNIGILESVVVFFKPGPGLPVFGLSPV